MKLLREFASWDCAAHAGGGAVAGLVLALGMPWWAAMLIVTAFGFGRELWQSRKDKTDPWHLSLHRWAEALAWLPGSVAGVVVQAAL